MELRKVLMERRGVLLERRGVLLECCAILAECLVLPIEGVHLGRQTGPLGQAAPRLKVRIEPAQIGGGRPAFLSGGTGPRSRCPAIASW